METGETKRYGHKSHVTFKLARAGLLVVPSGWRVHQQTLEILVEDIVRVVTDVIGI